MSFFTDKNDDEILIAESLAGNKDSLELLVKRHQDYIYNISLKLFLDPDDALDATQEVLIKIITSLKTFQGKSNFRTWIYRIAFNHFLSSPQRKMERLFERNFDLEQAITVSIGEEISPQAIEDVKILCLTGMLLCLNREQRLVYIVGDIFEADHNLGAELFDTTPANFRVKLHRAKADLLNYVKGKCGLMDANNPCRCNKKAKFFIEKGFVNQANLRFNTDYQQKISEVIKRERMVFVEENQRRMTELFQDSPFQIKEELDEMFRQITDVSANR
jgi:RNA polymerase sigma factor (sigma-70 family)